MALFIKCSICILSSPSLKKCPNTFNLIPYQPNSYSSPLPPDFRFLPFFSVPESYLYGLYLPFSLLIVILKL